MQTSKILVISLLVGLASIQLTDSTTDKKRWELFEYGDQTNPLYEENSVSTFLQLCGSYGSETCSSESTGKCIEDCTLEKRLDALKVAKKKVSDFLASINDHLRSGFLWVIWGSCCFGGIYLVLVGHFRLENLPILGNWLLDSPTDGIKFKHYMWMRWIILGNTNCHWLTYMKSGTKVFEWISLSKLPWNRPQTPTEVRDNEPRDFEHQEWAIETICQQLGVKLGDFEDLEEGWEKEVKKKLRQSEANVETGGTGAGGKDRRRSSNPEDDLIYEVLEEYWLRIFGWAWARYRYKLDPENLAKNKDSAPSVRSLINDDEEDD